MICKLKLLFFTMCLCIFNNAHASCIHDSSSSNISNCIETEFTKEINNITSVVNEIDECYFEEEYDTALILGNKIKGENDVQISILEYLKKCKLVSKNDIIEKLNEINEYQSYLFNVIFYNVFNNKGKVLSNLFEVLKKETYKNHVVDFIKSIENNKKFNSYYKCYVKTEQQHLTENFIKIIAPKIQEIVLQRMSNFATSMEQCKFRSIIGEFSNLMNQYNTFVNSNNIAFDSIEEEYLHALYLSDIFNNYIYSPNNTSNYSYTTITYNGNTLLLNADNYYDKCMNSFNKINKSDVKIEFNNKYDYNSSELISLEYISGTDNEITKICKQYLQSTGRSLVNDNEFQTLYCLFKNVVDISDLLLNKCNNSVKNNTLKINLFTYMDMCPSCWTAWYKCYNNLEQLYQNKISHNVKLNINVYSMKPYSISHEHPFINNTWKKLSNDNKNEIMNISNWVYINIRNNIRLQNIKSEYIQGDMKLKFVTNLENIKIKQLFDWDGFNMLNDYYSVIEYIKEQVNDKYIVSKIKNNQSK